MHHLRACLQNDDSVCAFSCRQADWRAAFCARVLCVAFHALPTSVCWPLSTLPELWEFAVKQGLLGLYKCYVKILLGVRLLPFHANPYNTIGPEGP